MSNLIKFHCITKQVTAPTRTRSYSLILSMLITCNIIANNYNVYSLQTFPEGKMKQCAIIVNIKQCDVTQYCINSYCTYTNILKPCDAILYCTVFAMLACSSRCSGTLWYSDGIAVGPTPGQQCSYSVETEHLTQHSTSKVKIIILNVVAGQEKPHMCIWPLNMNLL